MATNERNDVRMRMKCLWEPLKHKTILVASDSDCVSRSWVCRLISVLAPFRSRRRFLKTIMRFLVDFSITDTFIIVKAVNCCQASKHEMWSNQCVKYAICFRTELYLLLEKSNFHCAKKLQIQVYHASYILVQIKTSLGIYITASSHFSHKVWFRSTSHWTCQKRFVALFFLLVWLYLYLSLIFELIVPKSPGVKSSEGIVDFSFSLQHAEL